MSTPATTTNPALVDQYMDVDEDRTVTDQTSGLTVTFRSARRLRRRQGDVLVLFPEPAP